MKFNITVSGRCRPEHPNGCPVLSHEGKVCPCEIIEVNVQFDVEADNRNDAYVKAIDKFSSFAPGLWSIIFAPTARFHVGMHPK